LVSAAKAGLPAEARKRRRV